MRRVGESDPSNQILMTTFTPSAAELYLTIGWAAIQPDPQAQLDPSWIGTLDANLTDVNYSPGADPLVCMIQYPRGSPENYFQPAVSKWPLPPVEGVSGTYVEHAPVDTDGPTSYAGFVSFAPVAASTAGNGWDVLSHVSLLAVGASFAVNCLGGICFKMSTDTWATFSWYYLVPTANHSTNAAILDDVTRGVPHMWCVRDYVTGSLVAGPEPTAPAALMAAMQAL